MNEQEINPKNMNTFNNIKYTIITLVIAFTAFGCSNSSNNSSATINGSVEDGTTQQKAKAGVSGVEGAVVTAAEVTSNGSLQALDGIETETDASGSFSLDIDVESAQHIVIRAEKEGQTWMGYLSGKVENGSNYVLKPLNTESSAETEVFTRLVASGNADIVQKLDVEAVVTNQVASEINASSSYAATIATGLKNAAEARAEFYSDMAQENSEEALEATFEALAEAQFHLESELDASANAEQRAEAYDVFIESTVNAYLNAGLDASSSAKALEMWSRVFVNSITSVSSEVRNDARKNVSLVVAVATDLAVRAEAEASGMSESSQQAIVDAGLQLRSAIKASTGVASEVEAAFEEYHDEVRSTMESDGSFEASVIIEIDAEINSSNGAKITFSSAISTVLKASMAMDIYQTFYTDITGTVESMLVGASEAEVAAVSQLMILINLAS